MSTRHTITAEITVEPPGEYDEVAYPIIEIEYNFTKGSPEVRYLRNGDPGWPAESAEVEGIKAKLLNGDGLNPTEDQVYDWAEQWLNGEKGLELACENAAPPEREYERE